MQKTMEKDRKEDEDMESMGLFSVGEREGVPVFRVLRERPPDVVGMSSRPWDRGRKIEELPSLCPSCVCLTQPDGYRSVRGTHGAYKGTWYFVVRFETTSGHARVGMASSRADVNAPIGADKYGYSYASRTGRVFHQRVGKKYGPRYGIGDVITVVVRLGNGGQPPRKEKCDRVNRNGRVVMMIEDEETGEEMNENAELEFYLNGKSLGVARKGLPLLTYFPAVSIYGGAKVSVWMGPTSIEGLSYPDANPWSELADICSKEWNTDRDSLRTDVPAVDENGPNDGLMTHRTLLPYELSLLRHYLTDGYSTDVVILFRFRRLVGAQDESETLGDESGEGGFVSKIPMSLAVTPRTFAFVDKVPKWRSWAPCAYCRPPRVMGNEYRFHPHLRIALDKKNGVVSIRDDMDADFEVYFTCENPQLCEAVLRGMIENLRFVEQYVFDFAPSTYRFGDQEFSPNNYKVDSLDGYKPPDLGMHSRVQHDLDRKPFTTRSRRRIVGSVDDTDDELSDDEDVLDNEEKSRVRFEKVKKTSKDTENAVKRAEEAAARAQRSVENATKRAEIRVAAAKKERLLVDSVDEEDVEEPSRALVDEAELQDYNGKKFEVLDEDADDVDVPPVSNVDDEMPEPEEVFKVSDVYEREAVDVPVDEDHEIEEEKLEAPVSVDVANQSSVPAAQPVETVDNSDADSVERDSGSPGSSGSSKVKSISSQLRSIRELNDRLDELKKSAKAQSVPTKRDIDSIVIASSNNESFVRGSSSPVKDAKRRMNEELALHAVHASVGKAVPVERRRSGEGSTETDLRIPMQKNNTDGGVLAPETSTPRTPYGFPRKGGPSTVTPSHQTESPSGRRKIFFSPDPRRVGGKLYHGERNVQRSPAVKVESTPDQNSFLFKRMSSKSLGFDLSSPTADPDSHQEEAVSADDVAVDGFSGALGISFVEE